MGENDLQLLAAVEVGTRDARQIEIAGLPLDKAVHPFNPRRLTLGEPISP